MPVWSLQKSIELGRRSLSAGRLLKGTCVWRQGLGQHCLHAVSVLDVGALAFPDSLKLSALRGAGSALQGPLRHLGILHLAEPLAQAVDAAADVPPGGLL